MRVVEGSHFCVPVLSGVGKEQCVEEGMLDVGWRGIVGRAGPEPIGCVSDIVEILEVNVVVGIVDVIESKRDFYS